MASKFQQQQEEEEEEQYQELELQFPEQLEVGQKSLIVKNQTGAKNFLCSTPMKIIFGVIITILFFVGLIVMKSSSVHHGSGGEWINIKQQINTKSEDDSNYEEMIIPKNNLKVILITSKNLQMSGASLDVRAGSQENPTEFAGLAHLLEHMLFMGSQKYPEEDAFNSIVSKSSGSSNAYTDVGNTNYHFQGTHNNLIEILNIWSRFFIDPLLKEDQLQREVQAVNSEYMNTLTSEGFREFNLFSNLSDDGHPFKLFICGNTQSLVTQPTKKGLSTYQALRSFKKKYYFSENMALVIKSDESLRDELKSKIASIFQDIPTQKENLETYTEEDEKILKFSYTQTQRPPITKALKSVSLEQNKNKKLAITFLLEDHDDYKYSSLEFVQDLLKYGFDGSNLCFWLEDRKLVSECKIENEKIEGNFSKFLHFQVSLQFQSREDTIEEIVQAYFYYIDAVKNYPKLEQAYHQIKNLKKSLFEILDDQYQDSVLSEVRYYSKLVNQNKTSDILSSYQLYHQFNETHFQDIMKVLTDPSRVIIVHKTSNSSFTEGLTLIKDSLNDLNYTKSIIPVEEYTKFKQYESLNIPKAQPIQSFGEINDRILNGYSKQQDDPVPKLAFQNEKGRIYLQKDLTTFKKPQQQIRLKFQNYMLNQNVKTKAINQIFVKMLGWQLNRKSHLLQFARLSVETQVTKLEGGFLITITCLDSQVREIFQKVKESIDQVIDDLKKNPNIFEDFKQQQIDALNNLQNKMVYTQLGDLLNSFVHQNSYSTGQILDVIGNVSIDEARDTMNNFLEQFFLTIYAFGNVDSVEIQKQFNLLTQFNSKSLSPYIYRSNYVDFKNNPITLQLNFASGDHSNSVCANYYQLGKLNLKDLAILKLIEKPFHSEAFNYLRTQLQLGYVVGTKILNLSGFYNVFVLVQGGNHTPNQYDTHIEEFLALFDTFLTSLGDEEIQSMKESLILSLNTDQFDKFTEKADHYWQFINELLFDFNYNKNLIDFYTNEKLTKNDVLQFYQKFFKNTNSRFSVQLFNAHKNSQETLPIIPTDKNVYSGSLGTYITSREDFFSQPLDYLHFKDSSITI